MNMVTVINLCVHVLGDQVFCEFVANHSICYDPSLHVPLDHATKGGGGRQRSCIHTNTPINLGQKCNATSDSIYGINIFGKILYFPEILGKIVIFSRLGEKYIHFYMVLGRIDILSRIGKKFYFPKFREISNFPET